MDEELKLFLEENKELIRENKWCKLYQNAWSDCVVTSLANFLYEGLGKETMLDLFAEEGKIPDYAFLECTGLTSITIPSSVTSIGDSAFAGCSGLTSIEFAEPSRVTSIDCYAFSGCSRLTSLTIPSSVTFIDVWAFCDCKCHIIFECDKSIVTKDALKGFEGTYEFK